MAKAEDLLLPAILLGGGYALLRSGFFERLGRAPSAQVAGGVAAPPQERGQAPGISVALTSTPTLTTSGPPSASMAEQPAAELSEGLRSLLTGRRMEPTFTGAGVSNEELLAGIQKTLGNVPEVRLGSPRPATTSGLTSEAEAAIRSLQNIVGQRGQKSGTAFTREQRMAIAAGILEAARRGTPESGRRAAFSAQLRRILGR